VVLAAAAGFAVLSAGLGWARFACVHNRTFDLALYARQAWGLAHGSLWEPIVGGSFASGHLAWVLGPLGVLGCVFGTVPVLLCAQSLAIAASSWPLYRLAAQRLGVVPGAAVALGWLLQPNLGHVASYEFHPGTLALWPLMHACCAIERARASANARASNWVVAALLALACRASLALQLLPLCAVAAYLRPSWRRPAFALAGGVAIYFALWMLSLPSAGGANASAALHFAKWGGSPFGIVAALLHDPQRLLDHLLVPERATYLVRVLWPLALLPLGAPRWWWVALPVLGINLASEFPTSTQLYSHYLTPALPPLAVGAVAGAAVLRDRLARARWPEGLVHGLAPCALVLAALSGSALAGGLPGARGYDAAAFRADEATRAARSVLARIDATSSVQAPDRLLPHLAEREALFRLPPPERDAHWLVLDVAHRRRFAQREDLLRTVEEPVTRRWLARRDHQLVLAAGDLLLLERDRPVRGGLVRRYFAGHTREPSGIALCACLALRAARIERGALELELVARARCPSDLALRLGAGPRPWRVDLPFDGLLSPALLEAGDIVRSRHALTLEERADIAQQGLWLGALRSSGARPEPDDPISVQVPLHATAERALTPAPTHDP
jgi:hypothetical protein